MNSFECVAESVTSTDWVVKSSSSIVGTIRRSRLGEGFSLSHSSLCKPVSTESSVLEKGETANFVFVLKGGIRLKSAGFAGWQEMKQGRAYSFFTENAEIRRKTEAGSPAEVLIIKICRHKLENMMNDLGAYIEYSAPERGFVSRVMTPYSDMLSRRLLKQECRGETGRILQIAGATDLLSVSFLTKDKDCTGDRVVMELADYIRNSLDTEHSLQDLSKAAGMSHTKLNRLFRDKTGLSVFEFIRREKMSQAERYLRDTDMSITEIAYCTGFCSSSHFSDSFRREKGISPRHFRNRG